MKVKFKEHTLLERLSMIEEYLVQLEDLRKLREDEFTQDFRNYYTAERLFQIII